MKLRRRSFRTPVGCVRRAARVEQNGGKMKLRAYPSTLSLPGLTRQSILLRKDFLRRRWMRGSSPRMTSDDNVPRITPFGVTSSCTITFLFRRAFARGVISFASPTPNRGVGGAPRNVRVQRHPLGVHMTRHARRLRGALRPITRDARLSALHRGDFSPGAALPSPSAPAAMQRRAFAFRIRAASSSQPGRSAWRAGSRASRSKQLRAAAAGRHSPLRLQDRLRRRPSRARMGSHVAWLRFVVNS
jgi:hypothetical protein